MSSHQFGPWGAPRDARQLEALGYTEVPRHQVPLVKRWLTRLGLRHLGRRSRLHDVWVKPWLHETWEQDALWPGLLDVRAVIGWYLGEPYRETIEHDASSYEQWLECVEFVLCAGGAQALVALVCARCRGVLEGFGRAERRCAVRCGGDEHPGAEPHDPER